MGTAVSFTFCLLGEPLTSWLFWKCADWSEKTQRGGEETMYTVLFVLGVAVLGYLTHVLVKSEKF